MASHTERSIHALAEAGVLCAEQDILDQAFDEMAERLERRGFTTISYDVAGLAERIRAGKNGTPVPNPHKPYTPPARPAPKPQPRQDPPKPPPSKPGGR